MAQTQRIKGGSARHFPLSSYPPLRGEAALQRLKNLYAYIKGLKELKEPFSDERAVVYKNVPGEALLDFLGTMIDHQTEAAQFMRVCQLTDFTTLPLSPLIV